MHSRLCMPSVPSIRFMKMATTALAILFSLPALAEDQPFNLHFQSTVVTQNHESFTSPYRGQNSLSPSHDSQTSTTSTVFGGVKLWAGAEAYLNPELSGGSGFNKTQGLAGFPNGEIYRVDDANPKWSLARLFFKQTFGFGGPREEIQDDKNQLSTSVDVNRFTIVAGKFALNDYFDNNTYSHDPRTQFLNWVFMDHGAWDYAADTRGYSWGLYFEFNHPSWTVRFASVLEPLRANQLEMDTNFPTSRGDNLELESRYSIHDLPGAARLLLFANHARMGNYRATIADPGNQMDVTRTRAHSIKYGIGLNLEQKLLADLGAFLRASWDDGHTETWAFTEIDRSVSLGLSLKGNRWKRESDTVGLAVVANGLSPDHEAYLNDGGYGFIVGDGQLNYQPEVILEAYYLFQVFRGFALTGDYQFIDHPAYNADRGPVSVLSARVHYEM